MIHTNLSKPILVTSIPKEYKLIQESVNLEASNRGLEVINLLDSPISREALIERDIKGIIFVLDGSFNIFFDILFFSKFIPSCFLITDTSLPYEISWMKTFNSKYKKIGEKLHTYLDDIQTQDMNISIGNTPTGYSYTTYGNIYINPYPGLFIAIDYPDNSFGNELALRISAFLKANKIKNIYTNEPTDEISGNLIQKVKKGKAVLFEDTMQLLYTSDRIEHARILYNALQNSKAVVSARYLFSTLAYGYSDMPIGFLLASNTQVYWPDINIVLFDSKKRTHMDKKYITVNKAFKDIAINFKKNSTLIDLNEGLENATKKSFRLIRNHIKTKKYFESN